jgi:hypothetical protein
MKTHVTAASVVATELALRRIYVERNDTADEIILDGVLCKARFFNDADAARKALKDDVHLPVFVNEEVAAAEDGERGIFAVSGFNAEAMKGNPFKYKSGMFEFFGISKDFSSQGKGQVGRVESSWTETLVVGGAKGVLKGVGRALTTNIVTGAIFGGLASAASSSLTPQMLMKDKYIEWKSAHDRIWNQLCVKIDSKLSFRLETLEREVATLSPKSFSRVVLQGHMKIAEANREQIAAVSLPSDEEPESADALNAVLQAIDLHTATYFKELTALNRFRKQRPEFVAHLKGKVKAANFFKA